MDSASVFESDGCRFESCHGRWMDISFLLGIINIRFSILFAKTERSNKIYFLLELPRGVTRLI